MFGQVVRVVLATKQGPLAWTQGDQWGPMAPRGHVAGWWAHFEFGIQVWETSNSQMTQYSTLARVLTNMLRREEFMTV